MPQNLTEKFSKLIALERSVVNWPRALMDHLTIIEHDYVCHLRNGLNFEVRGGSDDRHVLFEIFSNRMYFPDDFIDVSPGNIVVDIGAHIGCFTLWAARKGARVLSFEPFPENFSILERNVKLNNAENVQLFQAAVSNHSEHNKLYLPKSHDHTGRYSLHPGRGTQTIDVNCLSLEDVLRENAIECVNLLKMDCQGSEYEILYGMTRETMSRIQAIVMECEIFEEPQHWSLTSVKAYLEDMGFITKTKENIVLAKRHP